MSVTDLKSLAKRGWDLALAQFADAQRSFARGDASPMKRLWATTDDVTIFGGFGGHQRGWDEVGPRLDWAASQFADGVAVEREHISSGISTDLAYAVHIDRFRAKVGPSKQEHLVELRVTQVWRRKANEWRIVHRHGDPLVSRMAPP